LVVFEPVVGVGLEDTKVWFHYDFKYEIPDTIHDIPTERISVEREIEIDIHSQNTYRVFAGFSFRLGFFMIHYDFNICPYATHNAILGLTFR
jgi:hypothetical protein